jgi:uncharacterized protein YegL
MDKWNIDDLVNNPSARIPICLCIDVSRSMSYHNRIDSIKEGIFNLYNELKSDFQIANSAEIAIVTFGNEAEILEDFQTVAEKNIPLFKINGNTALGKGVNLSLDILEQRKELYKQNGIDYYQPWLIIMTDGASYGETKLILNQAQDRAFRLEYSRKLVVIPISIGNQAKKDELEKFTSKKNAVVEIDSAQFNKFFAFISRSVAQVVQSSGKANVNFDLNTVVDWGEL